VLKHGDDKVEDTFFLPSALPSAFVSILVLSSPIRRAPEWKLKARRRVSEKKLKIALA